MHKFSPQSFGAIGKGLKFLVFHGTQFAEDCPLTGFQTVQRCAAETILCSGRHKGLKIPLLQHHFPHCGGGRVLFIRKLIMIAAAPVNGQWLHGRILRQDCLTVFHSQNVVGSFQQSGIQAHSGKRRLTGSREGHTLFQLLPEQGREFFTEQSRCSILKLLRICCFSTETKSVAEFSQNGDTAGGKTFGRGEGIFNRQLQNQVCAAAQSGFCTDGLIDNGRGSPLNKIAAHKADDCGFRAKKLPNPINLFLMSQVQRIIFTDDSDGFQNLALLFTKKFTSGLENLGKMKYNTNSYGYHITRANKMKYFFRRRFQ